MHDISVTSVLQHDVLYRALIRPQPRDTVHSLLQHVDSRLWVEVGHVSLSCPCPIKEPMLGSQAFSFIDRGCFVVVVVGLVQGRGAACQRSLNDLDFC